MYFVAVVRDSSAITANYAARRLYARIAQIVRVIYLRAVSLFLKRELLAGLYYPWAQRLLISWAEDSMGSDVIIRWVQPTEYVYHAPQPAKVVGVICTQRLYASSATAVVLYDWGTRSAVHALYNTCSFF
jgi:hypothetical protein